MLKNLTITDESEKTMNTVEISNARRKSSGPNSCIQQALADFRPMVAAALRKVDDTHILRMNIEVVEVEAPAIEEQGNETEETGETGDEDDESDTFDADGATDEVEQSNEGHESSETNDEDGIEQDEDPLNLT